MREASHAALKALVCIGEPAVVELCSVLIQESGSIRDVGAELDRKCAVASALGQIGGTRAAETLLVGLKHYQPRLRQASAKALMEVGSSAYE